MRKLLVGLMAVSMMVLPLFAQSTRTDSLSIGSEDTADIGNIITYPQLISMYKNKVWFNNLDGYNEQAILLAEVSSYTVGLGLGSSDSGASNPGPIGAMFVDADSMTNWGVAEVLTPTTTANLLVASEMGAGSLGLNLFWAVESYKDEEKDNYIDPVAYTDSATDPEQSASYLGMILGYGMKEVGPMASVEASFGLGLPGFETSIEDPVDSLTTGVSPYVYKVEKDSGMDMAINLLAVQELSDSTSIRWQAGFKSTKLGLIETEQNDLDATAAGYLDPLDTNNKWTAEGSVSDLGIRAALNKKVNEDGLLIVALGLGRTSYSTESKSEDYNGTDDIWETQDSDTYEYSELYLSANIAVEGKVKDAVTLRAGARKDLLGMWSDEDYDEDFGVLASGDWGKNYSYTEEESGKYSNNVSTSLGVGVTMGNFTCDADISSDLLFNGPYWITGDSSSFASQIDLTYAW